jgi:hypothetical protein
MNKNSTDTKLRSIKEKLNFKYFVKLFLISVFPIHFWTSIMIFNDLEYVSERTYMWDAFGYAGYSLAFALAESLLISLVLWLFSLAFPQGWSQSRTLSVVGTIYLILAGVSIVDMAAHAFNELRIAKQYLHGLENFSDLAIILILGATLIAIAISLLLILKTKKVKKSSLRFSTGS